MGRKGIGGHRNPHKGATDEWLTPPELVRVLGPFDLDPCSPVKRPWDTAKMHYTINDNGLAKPWAGRVWLNPPYGPATGKWLARLADYGDGIALIFARTETRMFFMNVWNKADAVLFMEGRIHFYRPNGTKSLHNSGAPSVLVAYGSKNAQCLEHTMVAGKFIRLKDTT